MTKKVLTVKREEDLIAVAPVLLGFQPERSVVMMTLNSFHARVDVPRSSEDIDECIDALLSPVARHGVTDVAFILFDGEDNRELRSILIDSFHNAGIGIIAALQVRDGQFRHFNGDAWRRVEIADNHVTLEAKYLDIEHAYSSRDELVEYLRPHGLGHHTQELAAIERIAQSGVEGYIVSLTRDNARDHKHLLAGVLRGYDSGSDIEDLAVCLGFACWLSGDGAGAWVAVDQAGEQTWAELLRVALRQAVPPSSWPY